MKKIVCSGALTVLLLGSSQAYAAGSVAAGAKIGTLGAGADLSLQLASSLNARLGIQGLSYNTDRTESEIDYDADLKLFSGLVTADWFPFQNGFRISPGLLANGNELDLNGRPRAGTTYEINGITYDADQVGSLNGNVDFNSLAPYLGVGWGNPFGAGGNWSFSFDLGVVFQGSPNVSLTVNGDLASNEDFLANLEAERRDLEDDLDDFKYYPVVSIGITYRF
jgi:hypothetical protein